VAASAFLSGDEYLSLPRDPEPWVIQHLIPVSGLTNVYGKPKAGKSFAALGMAHAISTGQPEWLGFPVLKHGPVAYLQIDTPRGEWAGRVATMRTNGYDVSNMFVCDMLMSPYPFNVLLPEHHTWLKDQLAELQPVVVFIDTIREAHGGDENDSTVMRNVVTSLVAACRPAAVVLLSHSRKDTLFTQNGGEDLMSDARGSSYIAGRMDAVIKFTTNDKHATGMAYKGRSAGNGKIKVSQHEETGLIILDGEDAKYWELVRKVVTDMRSALPGVSVNKIADELTELTKHKKKSMITKDVQHFMDTNGIERKVVVRKKKGK
jgi:RecA-family ATPase